ncbi:MAG TPA: hypothetical protein VN179_02045, partial [Solirubrobacterales bacterium]|nr:hypothetical protein [Solirubrobacterales bacterium]
VDYRIPVAAGRPGAADAEGWLDERGYERGAGWIKFVRDGSPPDFYVDPGITIYKLGEDEAEGEGLSTIAAEALEMPLVAGTLFFSLPQRNGWHCYTAALGPDEVIAGTARGGELPPESDPDSGDEGEGTESAPAPELSR